MEYERLILCFSLLSGIKYCKVITIIRIELFWESQSEEAVWLGLVYSSDCCVSCFSLYDSTCGTACMVRSE